MSFIIVDQWFWSLALCPYREFRGDGNFDGICDDDDNDGTITARLQMNIYESIT